MILKITCLLSPGCGSEDALRSNIAGALKAEAIKAEVMLRRIDSDEAERMGVSGSPTVLINGRELQPLANAGFS